MKFMMPHVSLQPQWWEAIAKRVSVRTYTQPPLPDQIAALRALGDILGNDHVRFAVLQGDALPGNITGTNCFMAVVAQEEAPGEWEGYLGEMLVLAAYEMGLGCCWLGTFDKKTARLLAEVGPQERITCIIAVGQYDRVGTAKKRKSIEKLCKLSKSEVQLLEQWQLSALRCAQVAPSALNNQPWRFAPAPGHIDVLADGNNFGYGPLDRGIAMAHLALGMMHEGKAGDWTPIAKGWRFQCSAQKGAPQGDDTPEA